MYFLRNILGALCGLLTIAAPTYSAAQQQNALDELDLVQLLNVKVSTATKTAESLDDAPAVITVVTQEDIRRWGYQSVAEVLQHTAGFYVVDDHILPNVGVRGVTGGLGAESGVIKVMIDGRSVAYRTTSGNWLGAELIPLESVAQIEILRGPASALYGADAFLGVVNILTVHGESVRPLRARTTAGFVEGNPSTRVDIAGGGDLGPLQLLLGAALEATDRSGLRLPEESPAPTLPGEVGERRTSLDLSRRSLSLQGRLRYEPTAEGHLELSAYAVGIERGGDFAHWAQLTNSTDQNGVNRGTTISLGQLRLNLDALLPLDRSLALALQSTYFRGGTLPNDRIEVASDLFYVEREQSYQGTDSMLEARFIPSPDFNLIAGVEVLYDREDFPPPTRVNRATGEALPGEGVGGQEALANLGAYASVNYKLFDPWLKLTGGIRMDHHSVYGTQWTGRIGTTSRWSRSLVTKILYGSAFKAPSPYLLYAAPLRPGDVVGNRQLDPQLNQVLEFQIAYTPSSVFRISSNVSQSWLTDKAEFTPQGINQAAQNIASQTSLAWETRADLRYHRDVTAYAAFDLVHSTRDLNPDEYAEIFVGDRNIVYPPWIARAGVAVALPSLRDVPLELGAQGMWVGPRRAADTSLVERGEDFSLPSYMLLDATLRTRELYLVPGHESQVALRGKNLLATRGPDPGFSGFEYPIRPVELFLELRHMY